MLSPASAMRTAPSTLAERLLTEARIMWDYVSWTLVPNLSQLSLYHDDYVAPRG